MNVTWAGKIYNEVYKLGQRIENLFLSTHNNNVSQAGTLLTVLTLKLW